ncbi:MAG: class I SAM-dependent methyltransferase [Planctomycetota bacterium]|nr:class I SAM-dependent methyltransferase [Planctomycetota bacterium]
MPCPVCDASDEEVLYEPTEEVRDPGLLYGAASGIRGTQRLVTCRGCGMIYESPRYPDEVIFAGYASSEESGHDSQHPMRVRSFRRALEKLDRHLPPSGSKVLDIGCAGGGYLEAAAAFGYDAVGLEPSRFLVEQGRQRGLQIEAGSIESHPFSAGSFDLVSFWDVIEHVPDPKAAIVEAARLLRPDGVLLINYPDIGTWQARIAGRRFWWILSVHLHHFSRRTLAEACRRSGVEMIVYRRYWQTLQVGYLQDVAVQLGVPLGRLFRRLTPGAVRRLPLPYYASQTTALARIVR